MSCMIDDVEILEHLLANDENRFGCRDRKHRIENFFHIYIEFANDVIWRRYLEWK
jgi:hypothetical protein